MWQILESSIMRILRNSICFFIIFSINTFSQENDFQVWESIRVSKKIYKRTNAYLSHGLRFRENSTILDKNYLDIKIAHRIRKTDRRIIMGYRISNILDLNFDAGIFTEFKFLICPFLILVNISPIGSTKVIFLLQT